MASWLGVASPEYVAGDGLVSFGTDSTALAQRAAYFADRILEGTEPANLSVEQPTKFELIDTIRTARALGLVVRRSRAVRLAPRAYARDTGRA